MSSGLKTLKGFRKEGLLKFLLPLIPLGLLFAGWQALSHSVEGFPTPAGTYESMIEHLSDPFYINSEDDKGLFWQVLNSIFRVFGGFAIAVAVGVPLGLAIGMNRYLLWMLNPFIQLFKPVSPLAWLPLALVVFKDINLTAVSVIFLTSVWPIIANTALGVKSVSEDYFNVARVLNFNPMERIFKIILPVAVPYIFTGMRLSLGVGWLVIVAAEMLTGGIGIGFWIWDEYNNLNYTSIVVGIFIIGIVGFLLDILMDRISNRFDYRTRGKL